MTLSKELNFRCRLTLLKCNEFESYNSLQAVFVTTELSIYHNGLPHALNKDDQVNQTIAYLVPQYLSDNRPVLPLFLAELRDRRYDGDALRDELNELCIEVTQALGNETVVSFVIGAMTQDEAIDLMTESVFDSPTVAPAERTRFQQFRQALQGHGIVDFLPYYGVHREHWKPISFPQNSIDKIVVDMVNHINQRHLEEQRLPQILVQFLSIDFFAKDRTKRTEALNQLRQSGGIFIIDAISLFHPVLYHGLSKSELSSNERVAMLVLSPVNASALQVNKLIEEVIESQIEPAFLRFDEHFDRLCELGVGDLRTLKRWLFAILPEAATIGQNQKPNPDNRKRIRKWMGEPYGIEQAIFREPRR
jgi:hypothetical protein